jgi:hypothetical protein
MANTVKLRVLRDVLVYRAGTIIPAVPRNQAAEWIRLGLAEEVKDPPAVESAAVEQRDAVESADIRMNRKKRR